MISHRLQLSLQLSLVNNIRWPDDVGPTDVLCILSTGDTYYHKTSRFTNCPVVNLIKPIRSLISTLSHTVRKFLVSRFDSRVESYYHKLFYKIVHWNELSLQDVLSLYCVTTLKSFENLKMLLVSVKTAQTILSDGQTPPVPRRRKNIFCRSIFLFHFLYQSDSISDKVFL